MTTFLILLIIAIIVAAYVTWAYHTAPLVDAHELRIESDERKAA